MMNGTAMQLTEIDLQSITHEIWAAVLGIDLHAKLDADTHHPDDRVVTGAVQITGDWSGAVTVQISESFAKQAAAMMFAMDADEVSDEDVADMVGELANMTGGNVKSGIGGSCQLSLPSVTAGRDYRLSIPGSQVRTRLAFDADGELVVVTLLERQAGAV